MVLVGDVNATPDEVGMPTGFDDAWLAAGHDRLDPADRGHGTSPSDHAGFVAEIGLPD